MFQPISPHEAVDLRTPELQSPEVLEDLRLLQSQRPQPFESLPPSAAAAPARPELLDDLRQLRGWYEQADSLERCIAQLSAKVHANNQKLYVARRQAAEAKSRKTHAAGSIPKLSRARRDIESRSVEMVAALKVERENAVQRAKTNKGLRRSLLKLHYRLGHDTAHTEDIQEVVKHEAKLEEVIGVEEDTLCRTIDGMSAVHERLTQQVSKEREKRVKLREAARAKLDRVEQSQVGLRDMLDQHEAAVSRIKERLSYQQEKTREAEHALAATREEARRASTSVEKHQDARRSMHTELLGVQRAHERLRSDLEMTHARLQEMSEKESKAQTCWRLKHMEQLDTRLREKRARDQDVVIAEEGDEEPLAVVTAEVTADEPLVNARAGGC